MSNKFDIVANPAAWTEIDQKIEWSNPNARWWRLNTPKRIKLTLYSKLTNSSVLYVWYSADHGKVVVYGSEIPID